MLVVTLHGKTWLKSCLNLGKFLYYQTYLVIPCHSQTGTLSRVRLSVCRSVCLSVCCTLYSKNYWTDFNQIWVKHALGLGINARYLHFLLNQTQRSQGSNNLQKTTFFDTFLRNVSHALEQKLPRGLHPNFRQTCLRVRG